MNRGLWPWPALGARSAALVVGLFLMWTGPASASGGFGLPRLTCAPCEDVAVSTQVSALEGLGSFPVQLGRRGRRGSAFEVVRGPKYRLREPGPPMTLLGWPVGMGVWGFQAGVVLGLSGAFSGGSALPSALGLAILASPALGLAGLTAGLLMPGAPTEMQRRVHYAGLAYGPGTLLATLGGGLLEGFVFKNVLTLQGVPISPGGLFLGGALASVAAASLIPTSVSMTRASFWAADLVFAMYWGGLGFLGGTRLGGTLFGGGSHDPRAGLAFAVVSAAVAAPLAPLLLHTLAPPEKLLTPERIAVSQWAAFASLYGLAFAHFLPRGAYFPVMALGFASAPATFVGFLWLSTMMPVLGERSARKAGATWSTGSPTTVRDKSGQLVTLTPVLALSF